MCRHAYKLKQIPRSPITLQRILRDQRNQQDRPNQPAQQHESRADLSPLHSTRQEIV